MSLPSNPGTVVARGGIYVGGRCTRLLTMAERIADIVRREWTWAGVEVEAASESKVRCRMPAVFRDVQNFVDTLSDHDLCVDMETTCHGNVASVVLVVYAPNTNVFYERSNEPGNECFSSAVGCAVVATQIALALVFNPWSLRHASRVLNQTSFF